MSETPSDSERLSDVNSNSLDMNELATQLHKMHVASDSDEDVIQEWDSDLDLDEVDGSNKDSGGYILKSSASSLSNPLESALFSTVTGPSTAAEELLEEEMAKEEYVRRELEDFKEMAKETEREMKRREKEAIKKERKEAKREAKEASRKGAAKKEDQEEPFIPSGFNSMEEEQQNMWKWIAYLCISDKPQVAEKSFEETKGDRRLGQGLTSDRLSTPYEKYTRKYAVCRRRRRTMLECEKEDRKKELELRKRERKEEMQKKIPQEHIDEMMENPMVQQMLEQVKQHMEETLGEL